MSTLWTPDGERPVRRQPDPTPVPPPTAAADAPSASDATDEEAMAAHLERLREQVAAAPAEMVVANHAYQFFELAAVHLSQLPPQLPQACLAIDALAAVVEGLAGRLGEAEEQLADGLAQLRMAYVQITRATDQPAP